MVDICEFIYSHTVLSYLEHHWKDSEHVIFKRLHGAVSCEKWIACMKLQNATQNNKHYVFAGLRSDLAMSSEFCKFFKIDPDSNIFMIFKGEITMINSKRTPWIHTMDRWDKYVNNVVEEEPECCICLEPGMLALCLRCSARYCKKCLKGKVLTCCVCSLPMKIVHAHNTCYLNGDAMNLEIGCLLKLVELECGVKTSHLFPTCRVKEVLNTIFLKDVSDEFLLSYMDVKRLRANMELQYLIKTRPTPTSYKKK